MRTKTQALKALATAQRSLNDLDARANAAATRRNTLALEAQTLGASYEDLEAATCLSTARVTQVLRKARQDATTNDSGE